MGLVVIFASITLAVLIFLMTGPTGIFTKKISLIAYFDNAGGLRVGAGDVPGVEGNPALQEEQLGQCDVVAQAVGIGERGPGAGFGDHIYEQRRFQQCERDEFFSFDGEHQQ